MGKGKFLLAGLGVALLVGACQGESNDGGGSAAAPTSAVAPPTLSGQLAASGSGNALAAAPTAEAGPVAEAVKVGRVIDGDTFELADGRLVRLLGIDSCEMDTYGGKEAKKAAEGQLTRPGYASITMTAEPTGDDKDRDGRLLRYVSVNGADFGEFMVRYDHTGVYQGEHDASLEYVDRLYTQDTQFSSKPPSGRECADPNPPVPSGGGGAGIDRDRSEPAPAPKKENDGGGGGSVSYKNCSDARAKGGAPVYAGEPGYSRKLDRDGDGVGCE